MTTRNRARNPGNSSRNTSGILNNVRVISYNIPEGERPCGIKVRFKIRVVSGKRAREIDARQAHAILEALQCQHRNQQPS
jgi:hypothetical protein